MLVGMCPHNPDGLLIGSKVTFAAGVMLSFELVDIKFPPTDIGMLPLRWLLFRSNSEMDLDSIDPWPNHADGKVPA